jgi:Protein of unknown function (DUF3467)
MAKKAKAKKSARSPDKPRRIRVVMDVPPDIPTYFVNYAEVNLGPTEITISSMRIPARLSSSKMREAAQDGAVVTQAEVQLVFPPSVAASLAKIMTTQIEIYEKQFGPIPSGVLDE